MEKEFETLLDGMDIPFDEALPILQDRLWTIAKEYNTTGADVFQKFMDWKTKK
ncbi:MAG: hypothetical protein ACRDD7_12775 [Peptostreptococcaceae bacterium]